MAQSDRSEADRACVAQNYLKDLPNPAKDIYKINNLTSAFTNTYNNTRSVPCAPPFELHMKGPHRNLAAVKAAAAVLVTGHVLLCLVPPMGGQPWPCHDILGDLCRDFIMTAFNMTEDQAITAITVGIDFSVSQVAQQPPHASTAGLWKDQPTYHAISPPSHVVCGLADHVRRVSCGESAAWKLLGSCLQVVNGQWGMQGIVPKVYLSVPNVSRSQLDFR